ncbi:MAG: hypothetical protein JOZ04_00540, partial [Acidimicrobiia bacterium]|nr:hypothetical protein [Acidimicrobiia bacterium]
MKRRLTLVVAPPGYGKTVLLREWAASSAGQCLAWITVGPECNGSGRLASGLRRSFAVGATTVLVDGLDAVTDPVALDEVALVIEQLPPTQHVVLATSVDPPLRFYRLRLSDDLAELSAGDLAVTHHEAVELLERATGEARSSSEVDLLLERTQGWALGLQLAAEALSAGTGVEQFCAGDRRVVEYFTTRVLDRQPEEVRRFLLSTSVLGRMTGPLCDFATGERRSHAILDNLEKGGLFVRPPDANRPWFEYHPLFRAVLLRQCSAENPTPGPAVLRRAAEWLFGQGDVPGGMDCLIDAGAWDDLVDASFTYGALMLQERRSAEVARWIERVPPSLREQRIRPQLLATASLLFGGDPAAARGALAVIPMHDASSGEQLVADVLLAFVALADGARVEATAAAERVLEAVEVVDERQLPNLLGLTASALDVRAGALVARGVASMYEGRLASARRDLEDVAEEAHGRWRASALGSRALVEAWSGNLTAAEELAGRTLALVDQLGYDDQSRTSALLALALVARLREDLDRAVAILDEVDRTGGGSRRLVGVWVATERALIAVASGQPAAARAVLGAPRASAHPSIPDGILARRRAGEAQVLLAAGNLDAAGEVLADGLGGEPSDVRTARVRLALERGDTAAARRLVEAWPDEPSPRADRERRLCLAVTDQLDGNEAAGCAAMSEVVAEADAEGDVGLFHALGDHTLGPARALYRAAPTAFLRGLVDRPVTARQPKPVKGLAEQLTDREYMVLVHLPTRQSNADIAGQLSVSLNTVKTHLKHIYRKRSEERR